MVVRFMGSGSGFPVVGIPPLTEDDGIVVPIADGWFSGRIATYSKLADAFAVGEDPIWVRSLNHHPCKYVPANWTGFAKFLGYRTIEEAEEDNTRPAFVIETPPEVIEFGVLQDNLSYRNSATVRLDPTAFGILVVAWDRMLRPGEFLDAGTVVCIGVRADVGGVTLRTVISAACRPGN